jgi:hypothetical protein
MRHLVNGNLSREHFLVLHHVVVKELCTRTHTQRVGLRSARGRGHALEAYLDDEHVAVLGLGAQVAAS